MNSGAASHKIVAVITLDEYFAGYEDSREIFNVLKALIEAIGTAEVRVSKSQVAFRRRIGFAWVWIPGKYLQGKTSPLVLTVSLPARDASPRWKEVVEPAPGRYIHHLELYSVGGLDAEVSEWLRRAWKEAG